MVYIQEAYFLTYSYVRVLHNITLPLDGGKFRPHDDRSDYHVLRGRASIVVWSTFSTIQGGRMLWSTRTYVATDQEKSIKSCFARRVVCTYYYPG